jgi:hypothetical protein
MDDFWPIKADTRHLLPIFYWNYFITFVGFLLGWHLGGAGCQSQHSSVCIGLLPFTGGLYQLRLVSAIYGRFQVIHFCQSSNKVQTKQTKPT